MNERIYRRNKEGSARRGRRRRRRRRREEYLGGGGEEKKVREAANSVEGVRRYVVTAVWYNWVDGAS